MSELREALEAAVEQESTNEPATTPEVQTAAVETSASATDTSSETPVQAEAKDEVASPEVPKEDAAGKKAEVPTDRPVETAEQKLAHRVDRPPTSWKKEAKGEWATVPLHIRQEVHRREMEVNRVLNETAPLRQQVEQLNQTVQPFMARIQSNGITPVQAIDALLRADYTLATAPKAQRAEYMAKLIAQYDIDVEALDAAIVAGRSGQPAPQSPQGFDPNQIQQLVQQQLNQALAPIYQQRQMQEQQVVQQAQHNVESMSLDPKYPHFDTVRQDMADLIEIQAKRGIALSLEDAYDRAVRINPETVERMSQQASMAQANQQHQLAQKAKLAASSVSGSPASGGSQQFAGDGSMRGAIEAAFSGARM